MGLSWLGMVHALRPLQFDRAELEDLIGCVRIHAGTRKRTREWIALNKIADKLESALRRKPATKRASTRQTPNDRQTALNKLRRELREIEKHSDTDDQANTEIIRMSRDILAAFPRIKG